MDELEQCLEKSFQELDISEEQQNSIRVYLNLVENKDPDTANHCKRCGLLGYKVGDRMLISRKALLYGGLLHDVGKALISPETLQMTEGYGPKQQDEMKHHPIDGYRILAGVHEFTAEVILRHHTFSGRGYPSRFPKSRQEWSKSTQALIDFLARMISIIDFYDAASNRENDKFGEKRLPEPDEVKNLLLEHNKGMEETIERLYDSGIFGCPVTNLFENYSCK